MPSSSQADPAGAKKLRVVIVDDSDICRASIKAMLEADGDVEVVGEGEDGFEALALVEQLGPDVVTMDVQMAGKSGLESVEQIMARSPVPIVVVTAEPIDDDSGVVREALEAGALEVVPKPSFLDAAAGVYLRDVVRRLAQTPVFHRAQDHGPNTVPVPVKSSGDPRR